MILRATFGQKVTVSSILEPLTRQSARIFSRDLVFDIGKWGFWASRSDEIVYSGIIGLFFYCTYKKKGLIWPQAYTDSIWPQAYTESIWPQAYTGSIWPQAYTESIWPQAYIASI